VNRREIGGRSGPPPFSQAVKMLAMNQVPRHRLAAHHQRPAFLEVASATLSTSRLAHRGNPTDCFPCFAANHPCPGWESFRWPTQAA